MEMVNSLTVDVDYKEPVGGHMTSIRGPREPGPMAIECDTGRRTAFIFAG